MFVSVEEFNDKIDVSYQENSTFYKIVRRLKLEKWHQDTIQRSHEKKIFLYFEISTTTR